MMKTTITLLISFVTINIFSQSNKLNGTWILDKFIFSDGKPIEVNDKDFSTYAQYDFNNNKMKIDGIEIPITITSNVIQTSATKIEYGFNDKYLFLKFQGDNKIACLLKPEIFLELYPEFQPKQIEYGNISVYLENSIVKPTFIYKGGFNSYLANIVSNYEDFPKTRNYFSAQFILTKDSKIKDIKIINNISEDFDKKAIQAILDSEKYFKNTTGKDFLINRSFSMIIEDTNKKNKIEKQIDQIEKKGLEYFNNNDFENAIKVYEKLKTINDDGSNNTITKISYIKLGISYLAINKIAEACESFKKAGDLTNFSVRNYLINFCSKK